MEERIDNLRCLVRSIKLRVQYAYHSELEKIHDLYVLETALIELRELEGDSA